MRLRHSAARDGPPALFASLRSYDRGWLRGDLVAGLTVWAVLVPDDVRAVVLDAGSVASIDITATRMLAELAEGCR